MIRRPYLNGYSLLPQPAHAWLSGQLASHWGNDAIDSPTPYESVVVATTNHDIGWLQKDGQPILNEHNQPLHFLEPALEDVEAMYTSCVTQVMQIDPYASLLVNQHMQTIYESRAENKPEERERLDILLDELVDNKEQTIELLEGHPVYKDYVDKNTLNHNYRILRICDLLSLFVCGAFPARDIEKVPTRYGDKSQTVKTRLIDENTLHVTPWLFDQPQITIFLQARLIPRETYESLEEYQEDFDYADVLILKKTITSSLRN